MRILMLGNSFTFVNDMPAMLAKLTGAEVVQHTRGGARLAEQMNPKTKMGAKTLAALENETWDYVVLQEMSNGPITARTSFLKSVELLCQKVRENGATPILYATWAYQKGGKQLREFWKACEGKENFLNGKDGEIFPGDQRLFGAEFQEGLFYDWMYQQMYAGYHEAAEQNACLVADVGKKFYELSETRNLYADDGCHPNEDGSRVAAEVIAGVVFADCLLGSRGE